MKSSVIVPAKRRVKRKSSLGLAVGLQESSVLEECRFIPLRLDERERGLLAMLKGALNVSEYTDRQVKTFKILLEKPHVDYTTQVEIEHQVSPFFRRRLIAFC